MKRLSAVFLLLGLAGCQPKFSSMAQAINECAKWAENEEWNKQNQRHFRICKNEKETSQVLGYVQDMFDIETTTKPVKHFRY